MGEKSIRGPRGPYNLKYLHNRHPSGVEVTDIDKARAMDITVVKYLNLIRVAKRKIKADLNQRTVN